MGGGPLLAVLALVIAIAVGVVLYQRHQHDVQVRNTRHDIGVQACEIAGTPAYQCELQQP